MFNKKTPEQTTILEQYKIAVEMADKISIRRENTNKFFLSINSLLLAGTGGDYNFIKGHTDLIFILGILLSITWLLSISSYRKLNSTKYKIICGIENKYLPVKIYSDERSELKGEKSHKSLTYSESFIPLFFIIFFVILICINHISYIKYLICN